MFKLHNMRSMAEAPFEIYDITDAEEVVLGEALVLSSGKLTKCSATATPEFISMGAGTGIEIPVIRVDEKMVFETTFAADGTALNEGDKVTIHTDGVQVTATTTNGVFAITKKLGTGASGTKVLGMFRR